MGDDFISYEKARKRERERTSERVRDREMERAGHCVVFLGKTYFKY